MAMERAVKLLAEYADATIQTGKVVYDNSVKDTKIKDVIWTQIKLLSKVQDSTT